MDALYRVQLPDGARLALGAPDVGPARALPVELTLDGLLSAGVDRMWPTVDAAATTPLERGVRLLAPVESQEVWAAGVTYAPSRDARKAESVSSASVYDAVFGAHRPELFFKAAGWRVRGPGEAVAIRSDSAWNVPEPEVALVLDPDAKIAGVTIGDDVSSRSIEGANPLYLPQAKVYDGSCSVGPCIVRPDPAMRPDVELAIRRAGAAVFQATTSVEQMVRPFEHLAGWLGRALTFPQGAVLLTGTGIVPDAEFTLRPGDEVSIAITGLGTLTNTVEQLECGEAPSDE